MDRAGARAIRPKPLDRSGLRRCAVQPRSTSAKGSAKHEGVGDLRGVTKKSIDHENMRINLNPTQKIQPASRLVILSMYLMCPIRSSVIRRGKTPKNLKRKRLVFAQETLGTPWTPIRPCGQFRNVERCGQCYAPRWCSSLDVVGATARSVLRGPQR